MVLDGVPSNRICGTRQGHGGDSDADEQKADLLCG
jgi:hypothetical protein